MGSFLENKVPDWKTKLLAVFFYVILIVAIYLAVVASLIGSAFHNHKFPLSVCLAGFAVLYFQSKLYGHC